MTIKITSKDAQNIIDSYLRGESSADLAVEYGMRRSSLCKLIQGYSWKNCIRPDNIREIAAARSKETQLKVGHRNEWYNSLPPLTPKQNDILIGSLLGDGYIVNRTHLGQVERFSKEQCVRRKEYLDWHLEQLQPYSCTLGEKYSDKLLVNNKRKVEYKVVDRHLSGFRFDTHSHPVFTGLLKKWYSNNKKIVPSDLELTENAIAVWYWDDGCNDFANRKAVIYTNDFTIEEAEFLVQKLKKFDIQAKVWTRKSVYTGENQPMLYFGSKSYDDLINLVKPYLYCNCFAYKVKWRKSSWNRL